MSSFLKAVTGVCVTLVLLCISEMFHLTSRLIVKHQRLLHVSESFTNNQVMALVFIAEMELDLQIRPVSKLNGKLTACFL